MADRPDTGAREPLVERLREEWEALGLMSYSGMEGGFVADLNEDDIAKIRALLHEAGHALAAGVGVPPDAVKLRPAGATSDDFCPTCGGTKGSGCLCPRHPGVFAQELAVCLDATGMPHDVLARAADMEPRQLARLLAGVEPVTAEIAERVGRMTGVAPRMWLALAGVGEARPAEPPQEDLVSAAENAARETTSRHTQACQPGLGPKRSPAGERATGASKPSIGTAKPTNRTSSSAGENAPVGAPAQPKSSGGAVSREGET